MVDPEYVLGGLCIVDNLGPEVDTVRTSLVVKCILVLESPVAQVGARVDPEGVVVSEAASAEASVDAGALLGRDEAVLNLAVLVAHRVVPVEAVVLPLHNVAVVSVHEVALDVFSALSVGDGDRLGHGERGEQQR